MDNSDEDINEIRTFVTLEFSRRFSQLANKLALADYLTCSEFSAARNAGFYAALCTEIGRMAPTATVYPRFRRGDFA
jgi:hypothetical protein